MKKLLGKTLHEARKQRGFTQQQVADALGVSRVAVSQWENGTTDPSTDNLIRVCSLLDVNISAATSGLVKQFQLVQDAHSGTVPKMVTSDNRPGFQRSDEEFRRMVEDDTEAPRERDVPIYASGYAGLKADFFRTDEVISRVRRPHGAGAGTYATYVASDVLAPRYEQGELIYLTPGRPAVPGDYIAIKVISDDPEYQCWLLRRLVKQDSDSIVCETLTPPGSSSIAVQNVQAVHRVLSWGELVDNS